MATLKLALLGRPQIFLGDEPLSHLKSQKAQALIFYLAVTGQGTFAGGVGGAAVAR